MKSRAKPESRAIAVTPVDLLEYVGRRVADQQLRCVLAFQGSLDVERLRQAVRLTLQTEPVLGCRFREHPWRCRWERRTDEDAMALVRLIHAPDLEEAVQGILTTPADPRVDPLFEATVLRAETDTLCIRVDHVVADAAGMLALVRLLGTLYTGLATDKGLRATHSGASRALGQILREVPRQRRSALPPTVKTASSPLRLTQRGDPGAPRAMLLRRLGRSHLAAIRAYRIARNATTNDVLIGAVSHALWQAQGEPSGPHRVQVSVDLRRLVPGLAPARACNLAGAVFPVIDFRPGQPFDDTVASASAAMRAIEAAAPGLASARRIQAASRLGLAGMRALFAAMRARGAPVLPAIFSNLGMVGAHLDFEGIPLREAYSTGPVMVPPSFMLAVSSHARGITCSVGTVAQGPARAEAERVLDGFLDHLPKPS